MNDANAEGNLRGRIEAILFVTGEPVLLEELQDVAADGPEQLLEAAELSRLLDRFLRQLPQKECCIFMRRYWYMDSLEEIASRYHLAMGTVKSSLYRTRQKLREYLEQEGVFQ